MEEVMAPKLQRILRPECLSKPEFSRDITEGNLLSSLSLHIAVEYDAAEHGIKDKQD